LERKLTAILCADVYDYSRLMGENEEATLQTLSTFRKIIDILIENHRGRFVNSAGDRSGRLETASVLFGCDGAIAEEADATISIPHSGKVVLRR
jgi:class 3 adenylate cyclase